MDQWLGNPIIQSVAVPLLVAVVLTGILGFVFGSNHGAKVAAIAIPAGFAATFWITVGWPPFPPISSSQKVIYVVVIGALAGLVLDIAVKNEEPRGGTARVASILWPVLIVAWMGWRDLTSPTLPGLLNIVGLWLGGVAIFAGLRTSNGPGSTPTIMLLVAALGASFVALLGSSASIMQLSIGLAAATGGFLLWNWPKIRFAFGSGALFGGAGALLALGSVLALFSSANKIALIILVLVFFADRLAVRLPMAAKPALGPVVLGLICLVPAAIAVLVAYLMAGDSGGYALLSNDTH